MRTIEKMKAARWYAAKDIRVEDAEIPTPKENQVKKDCYRYGSSLFKLYLSYLHLNFLTLY